MSDWIKQIEATLAKGEFVPWILPREDKKRSIYADAIKAILALFKTPSGSLLAFEMDGRLVSLCLDNGVRIGFLIKKSQYMTADVKPIASKIYVIEISTGLLFGLWHLNVAIWSDSEFLSEIRTIAVEATTVDRDSRVPRGMERIFFQVANRESSLNRGHIGSQWLEPAVKQLIADPIRQLAFEQSFKSAIQWCWMHECGHAALGHLEWDSRKQRGVRIFQDMFSASPYDTIETLGIDKNVSFAAELQADRYATVMLSVGLRKSKFDNDLAFILSSLTGFITVPLCFHGRLLAAGQIETCQTHPPLWSRAGHIKKWNLEVLSTNCASSSNLRKREYAIDQLLGNLSQLHAAFGDLLAVASSADSVTLLNDFESQIIRDATNIEQNAAEYIRSNFIQCAD